MRHLLRFFFSVFLGLATTTVVGAPKPKTLMIYSYDSWTSKWGPGPKLKELFEKECSCVLKFVTAPDSVALLNRIKLEGTRSPADVILGLDSTLTSEARATNLFAPNDIKAHWDLPVTIEDTDLFQPLDYGWYALMYNTKALAKEGIPLPTSWNAILASPEFKKQLIVQDPRSSAPGLGLMLWFHAQYKAEAAQKAAALKDKVALVGASWSDTYSKFLKGEGLSALSYVTSEAYHIQEEKADHLKAMMFTDGHYLQVETAAKLKSSQNQALAAKFMAFLATPAVQAVIASGNWMYPALSGAAPLPAAYAKLNKPQKTLYLQSSEVAKHRKQWTDEWIKALTK